MKIRNARFNASVVFGLAALLMMTDVHAADAQNTRNWDRRVAVGEEMEFQWLNYDEKTCKDRGYPRLIINTPPKLGSYRAVRRKFTQQNGRCKGKKLSVLLVYYVAGRTKGRDRTSYTIRGHGDIRINLRMRVY
ncbi:hypothetical protein OS190_11940 [Sulfitobacter sp. F26204]|uniref:hypothetical protein n=1 Tax=Sulfitobacter sp. F26204 TaxID=2996014 RepID=UPI00225DF87C|nr:hypothetical protein [Sulfitobacter sp. F26204]MCX7560281.1 hypothetical protein [Sulfitobacter sp. F26204]